MAELKIAYFITDHGFGHGTRSLAVIDEFFQSRQNICLHIYSKLPRFLFEQSIDTPFELHPIQVDLGLAQLSPTQVDLEGSLCQLEKAFDSIMGQHQTVSSQLLENKIDFVLCDVSALGLLAAKTAQLPAYLVENFTWDWMYGELIDQHPQFSLWAKRFQELYQNSTLRFRCFPFCGPPLKNSLTVGPVARKPKKSAKEVREELGVREDQILVFLTLGGWVSNITLKASSEDFFLLAAGRSGGEERGENYCFLPAENPFFHPDLIQAADVVICKLGYSTVIEAFFAKTALLYLPRPEFPESSTLADFVEQYMTGKTISLEQLEQGRWAEELHQLSTPQKPTPSLMPGEQQIVSTILKIHDEHPIET